MDWLRNLWERAVFHVLTLIWCFRVLWRYETGRWYIFRDVPTPVCEEIERRLYGTQDDDMLDLHGMVLRELHLRKRSGDR